MDKYLSSSSLKSLAKGQLLGKYGILIGVYAIHIICVSFVTLSVPLFSSSSIVSAAISSAVSFLLSLFAGLFVFGETYIYLKLACNQKVSIRDLFYGFSKMPDKIIKVQAFPALISLVCSLPALIFSLLPVSLATQPRLILIFIVLILACSIIDIIVAGLIFSQRFYLMLDFPQYTAREVLSKSRKIMRGNKRRLFYIDLSFIPLILLGFCTLGIGFLWILPYYQSTRANFYLDLMKKRNHG